MRGLLILGGAGAAAFYAYKAGYFPQFGPIVQAVGPLVDKVSHILPQELWTAPEDAKQAKIDAIKEASGGQVVPILGPSEVATVNKYEGMLRSNRQYMSAWAASNIGWAAAIARVENAKMNPKISGDNGTSHGVYQVKVATAEACARAGYSALPPTKETLLTYQGGVYFGTAEMERLSKMGKGLDWTICAYNGGAGWEEMGATYVRDRNAYLGRVKAAFAAMYQGNMA